MTTQPHPTAAQITAEGRRFWGVNSHGLDTEWTAPGETGGLPDRNQTRLYRGLRLSAGSDARDNRGLYLTPVAPWSVTAALPVGYYPAGATMSVTHPRVATGVSSTQDIARAAAEAAADEYLAGLDAVAPVPASAERCLDCDTVPDPAFGGCRCQRDVGDLEDKFERALAAGGAA